jgi:uncharacterized protein (TIGR02266 family)
MSAGQVAPASTAVDPHQRKAERHHLEVSVDFESDSNFYAGLSQNISAGGLFIATHRLKNVGERIHLKFTLPGASKPIECETEVRWIRENSSLMRTDAATGMGVRFLDMAPADTATIQKFLESRESLLYDDE